MPKLKKVLIANRGEIAVRIIRTCREMALGTVAVYSEADRVGLHVLTADEAVCVGPARSHESYLNIDRILAAATKTGADAIHPGYGFLSENPKFARACADAGFTFIGPPASAMEAMGDKTTARANMVKANVPVVPGTVTPLASLEEATRAASEIGYPVMLKASAGGGGKGMRRVGSADELAAAWRAARSESQSSFGNDAVYLEKLLTEPHHVEIQVFADSHGNCIHLNERECSAQRRNQKVIEETPSAIVNDELRAAMGAVAVRAAKAVGYLGAGTVEFLVDAERNFYFLEMNTRLQVEHPVTEWVTGQDLVGWQLRVAQGEALPLTESPVPRGHAIEARVYAEDPAQNFMPSPGTISALRVPAGPFVRDDTGVYAGCTVPTMYDPMISKLSAWGPTRAEAIARLDRALAEYVLVGITTNLRYLRRILSHPAFVRGDYDTGLLGRDHAELIAENERPSEELAALALAVRAAHGSADRATPAQRSSSSWRQRGRWRDR